MSRRQRKQGLSPPGREQVHEAGAAVRAKTDRRRIAQPLLTALDVHLGPVLRAKEAKGVLLAVSGGPDSRALLEACARWRGRFDGVIHVATVDHATKTSSRAEADAVLARARVLGFEASVLSLPRHRRHDDGADADADDEAALRAGRYRALFGRMRTLGLGVVVTAHHEGDVAEGAMMSWLGHGGRGAAMPAASVAPGDVVIRPFLDVPRATIREALWAWAVSDDVIVDPEARSLRARMRREELVALGASRAAVERALARAARHARDDDAVLEELAKPLLAGTEDAGREQVVQPGPPALVRRALRRALRAVIDVEGDVRSSARAIEVVLDLMRRGTVGEVHLTGAVAAVTRSGAERRLLVRIRASPRTVAASTPPTHDGHGTSLSQAHPLVTLPFSPSSSPYQEEDT